MSNNLNLFNDTEARILACLMEKQLTVPDQYPLTLNSLVSACNQKTNRNPVMNLTAGELGHTLNILREKDWISVEDGVRVAKYSHRFATKFKLNKAEQAVLAILILRGPQTLNELSMRTDRMTQGNTDALLGALDVLVYKREQPLIELLDPTAGQREQRYQQLIFEATHRSNSDTKLPSVPKNNVPIEDKLSLLEQEIQELKDKLAQVFEHLNLP